MALSPWLAAGGATAASDGDWVWITSGAIEMKHEGNLGRGVSFVAASVAAFVKTSVVLMWHWLHRGLVHSRLTEPRIRGSSCTFLFNINQKDTLSEVVPIRV